MFSGFSNQVNSWMGAVKGEPHDEEVPTPTAQQQAEMDAAAAAASAAQNTATQQQQQQQQSDGLAEGGAGGAEGADGGVAQAQSPTKAGGMFSGMKTQMSGWLGNAAIPTMPSMPAMPAMPAIPSMPTIPGLRKAGPAAGADAEAAAAAEAEAAAAALQTDGLEGGAATGDEEDRSRYISATEGADSGPVSGQGTPSEEKAGQMGTGKKPTTEANSSVDRAQQALRAQFQSLFDRDTLTGTHAAAVTTKVTQGAKTFGSFLYSAANKAGSKIKESVKSNPILGEFNKEQDAFIRGQQGADAPVAPWVGHPNEEQVKEEILGLSADRRNFVRAPPTGVEFEFNYDVSYPIAVAIMSEDAALEKMRFDLVPKIITEENFWRNYFYRVSLICQASDADAYGSAGAAGAAGGDLNEAKAKTVPEAHVSADSANQSAAGPPQSAASGATKPEAPVSSAGKRTISETEFVSDTFQATETDLEEVKAGIRLLGIDSLSGAAAQVADADAASPDEQWEKQLASELQDFELVDEAQPKTGSNNISGSSSNNAKAKSTEARNWESDLLDEDDEDCEDLK